MAKKRFGIFFIIIFLQTVAIAEINAQSGSKQESLFIGKHHINVELRKSDAIYKPDSVWMQSRFSMFIHWGLYSQLGGVWEGKPVRNGYSEQIQSFAGIFSDYYEDLMKDFTATGWNADSIVMLAKRAGMKSIVFTAKHHDGFCMYNSRFTDFTVMHTPFGRDPLKELSIACKKEGLRMGVYFSLIDWHFPQAYPISSHNADPVTAEHHKYNMAQVEELLTNYGLISEFWFDMGSLTQQQSMELAALVRRLQPRCMISSRLGNNCGDFAVMPDNKIPGYIMGQPWQTAASMFKETWGYRSWQERGLVENKIKEKISDLLSVVEGGGNYLLNIGPRGDGSVVEFERDVLLGMGKWISEHPYFSNSSCRKITAIENSPKTDSSLVAFLNSRHSDLVLTMTSGRDTLYRGTLKDTVLNCYGAKVSIVAEKLGAMQHERFSSILFRVNRKRAKVLSLENGLPIYCYSSRNYYDSYMKVCGIRWE